MNQRLLYVFFVNIFYFLCLTLAQFFLAAPVAFARPGESTYGFELTFTDDVLEGMNSHYNHRMLDAIFKRQNKLGKYLQATCSECTIVFPKRPYDSLIVSYADGFSFAVKVDNGVLEVTGTPLTLKRLKELRERIHRDIFKAMEEIGLKPSILGTGAGHISQGIESTFGDNAVFFRNALADNANHPEVAKVYRQTEIHSRPIVLLPRTSQVNFATILNRFDQKNTTIPALASEIVSKVYEDPRDVVGWNSAYFYPQDAGKTHAHNVKKAVDGGPAAVMEHRAHLPQRSVDELIAQVELIDKRTEWVWKQTQAGVLIPFEPVQARALFSGRNLSTQEVMNRYYSYVYETLYESGNSAHMEREWKRYRAMLRPPYNVLDVDPNHKSATISRVVTQRAIVDSCLSGVQNVIIEHVYGIEQLMKRQ